MDRAASHDAGCCRKTRMPSSGQGVGKNEEHVHAGHQDDAKKKNEKNPNVFCIGHVSYPPKMQLVALKFRFIFSFIAFSVHWSS